MLMQPNPRVTSSSLANFAANAATAFDLNRLMEIGRRHRVLVGVTTLIVVLFAGVFALTSRPMYSGTAFVIIDTRNAHATDPSMANAMTTQLGLDSPAVDSQVEIVKGERIALKVIREWKLAELLLTRIALPERVPSEWNA